MDIPAIERAIAAGKLYECSCEDETERLLLVFVPGLSLKPLAFGTFLLELLREDRFQGCDLLPFEYPNHMTSRADPGCVASDLTARIEDAMSARGYTKIFLMGHSIGALLVRDALLQAYDRGNAWPSNVQRLVLLAGTNRGFVPGTRFEHLGASFTSFLNATFNISLARLIMDMQLGSTWVTSLRMRWLRTFAACDPAPPEIVQIYGDQDLVVSADDALDINRYDNSEVERLPEVDHEGFKDINRNDPAFARIVDAFFRELPGSGKPRTKERKRLVFLIHGIRDFAEWHYALDYEIEKRDEEIDVVPVQYGYFNILQFLLPHQQSRAVRVFVDKYVEEVSLSPSAKVVVAAHSNGTRVFQQAVAVNEFIQIDRAYFAGSVLPTGVRWSEQPYRERVTALRNVCATKDVPVSFLCRALQWLPVIGRGLGTAGYHGFVDKAVDNQVLDGGHGAALTSTHRESVARYLVGDDKFVHTTEKPKPPQWVRVLSAVAPFALVCVLYLIYKVFEAIAGLPNGYGVALSATFTFLLLLVLQRV